MRADVRCGPSAYRGVIILFVLLMTPIEIEFTILLVGAMAFIGCDCDRLDFGTESPRNGLAEYLSCSR